MHSINYSDRSFVLFGEDTINHRDLIKSLGGRWNRNLTNPITGERFGGWIFSNGRFNAVSSVLGNYIEPSDEYLPSAPELQQPYAPSDEYLPSAPELQQPPSDEYISSATVKSSYLISNMLFLCFVFMLCYIIGQELQEI
jgi:hypothetical protein